MTPEDGERIERKLRRRLGVMKDLPGGLRVHVFGDPDGKTSVRLWDKSGAVAEATVLVTDEDTRQHQVNKAVQRAIRKLPTICENETWRRRVPRCAEENVR